MQIFRFFCISSFWNSNETRHFSLLTILSSAEWMFACAFHDYNFRRIILPSRSVSRKETFPMFAMQIGLYSKLDLFFLNHFIWNFLTNSPQPFADAPDTKNKHKWLQVSLALSSSNFLDAPSVKAEKISINAQSMKCVHRSPKSLYCQSKASNCWKWKLLKMYLITEVHKN